MTSLLEVGLINAALATGLAMIVWLATRVWRHPVFVHTLWVVVLLKLITPPVVNVPWRFSEQKARGPTSGAMLGGAVKLPADQAVAVLPTNTIEQPIIEQASITLAPIEAAANTFLEPAESLLPEATPNEAVHVPAPNQERHSANFPVAWKTAVITIWLIGTIVYLFVSAVRLLQFHRALSHAAFASEEIQRLAAELARRFGISQRYRLRVTEGRLSPLVWPIGRPTILMPRRLITALSREEVETLLAHEFAHLCRRDHWLRWLELVVTGAYWWHPVVWWAKAAIQRAEEKACDAWVVSGLPDASAPYASALFKAIQFASAGRQATPVMASALAGRDLKERIEHIMNATWKPRLLLPVRLLVLAAAMLVLPLSLRAVGEEDQAIQPVTPDAATTDEVSVTAALAAAAATGDAVEDGTEAVQSADVATSVELEFAETPDAATSTEVAIERVHDAAAYPEAPPAAGESPVVVPMHVESRPAMQPRRVSVPADPYHIAAGDVLFVSVSGAAADAPIRGDFIVEPSGSIALGPQYGRAKIGGLSLEDAEKAVTVHLKETLRDPKVQITIGGWRDAGDLHPYPKSVQSQPMARTLTRAPSNRRVTYPQMSVSTPAPAVSESIGVLGKIVQRSQREFDRMKELADRNTVSAAEVARAQSEYEISVERLKQGERALRVYRVQVDMAEADFAALAEARMRAPGAVTEAELRRAKLAVELARAKLEELAQ